MAPFSATHLPVLPPALDCALHESLQRSDRLYAHVLTEYPGSLRADIATRWLLMCLDHREAFMLLVRYDARSSATALLRPIFESYTRGYWAINVATDAQLAQVVRNELPKFETVSKHANAFLDRALQAAQDLDVLTPAQVVERRGSFAAMKHKAWRTLSEFAHGGMAQLARWTTEDGTVTPAHTDAEVISWLKFADLQAVLACVALCDVAGKEAPLALVEIAAEIRAQ